MSEFSAKQQVALCRLAAGGTNSEAAEAAGVSLSCVEKWKAKPDFQKSLKDAVGYVFDAAIAELVAGSRDAAKELKRIINDQNVTDRIKVSAIQTLFSTAEKCKQWQLEARLERVEALLDAESEED